MRINQNIAALTAYRNLSANQGGIARATERLSSGLRINRAADDAAGLAIAEGMRAQVNGMNQASRNTSDGVSLLQTAEGGLNETHAILQRMRVLAVQAANTGVMNADTLGAIQTEMTQLTADIDRIAGSTEFNGMPLLDGTFRNKSLQVGANAGDTELVTITSGIRPAVPGAPAGTALWDLYKPGAIDALPKPFVVESGLTGQPTASTSVDLTPVPSDVPGLVAALRNDPDFSAKFTVTTGSHTLADGTTVSDANLIIHAKEDGAGSVAVPNMPAGAKVKHDRGSDAIPEHVGGFGSIDILGAVVDVTRLPGSEDYEYTTGGPSEGFGDANDVDTDPETHSGTRSWGSSASEAITQIDRAIEIVSKGRADMGAQQNGLDHVIRNLGVSAENLAVGESRIRDADMAKEISQLQRWQITAQASMEMLTRANQLPQGILKLLQ